MFCSIFITDSYVEKCSWVKTVCTIFSTNYHVKMLLCHDDFTYSYSFIDLE